MATAETVDTPSVAQFRRNLLAYFAAAEKGKQFQIIRYRTPIAILGPIKLMPQAYKSDAQLLSIAEARDDFPSITKDVLLKKSAIVIRKLGKGPALLPKKGARRKPIARDYKEVIGLWPVTEPSLSDLTDEVKGLQAQVSELTGLIVALRSEVGPLVKKLEELGKLDEEIAEKRQIAENLDKTIRRIGGHGSA